jgi:hypothetical protein
MALKKRKQGRDYTIDEMMYLINYKFIIGTSGESYVISNTAHKESHKKIIICDAKYESDDDDYSSMDNYFGNTILEAVTNCFNDRENHEIYDKNASLDG